jgi:hypothetical protein
VSFAARREKSPPPSGFKILSSRERLPIQSQIAVSDCHSVLLVFEFSGYSGIRNVNIFPFDAMLELVTAPGGRNPYSPAEIWLTVIL